MNEQKEDLLRRMNWIIRHIYNLVDPEEGFSLVEIDELVYERMRYALYEYDKKTLDNGK